MQQTITDEEVEAAYIKEEAADKKVKETQTVIDNSKTEGGTAKEKTAHTKAVNAWNAASEELAIALTDYASDYDGKKYVRVSERESEDEEFGDGESEDEEFDDGESEDVPDCVKYFDALTDYLTNDVNKLVTDICGQQRITLLNILNLLAKGDAGSVAEVFSNLVSVKDNQPSLFSVDTAFSSVPYWGNSDEANAYTTLITIVNMVSDTDYKGVKIDANTAGNIIALVNNEAGERVRYYLTTLPEVTSNLQDTEVN